MSKTVYHGTPADFEEFSTDAIGRGEGNQVYGWGLYFTESRAVGEYYKKHLSDGSAASTYVWNGQTYKQGEGPEAHALSLAYWNGIQVARNITKECIQDFKKGEPHAVEKGEAYWQTMLQTAMAIKKKTDIKIKKGYLYEAQIPDGPYLMWDLKMSQQPSEVQKALEGLAPTGKLNDWSNTSWAQVHFESKGAWTVKVNEDGTCEVTTGPKQYVGKTFQNWDQAKAQVAKWDPTTDATREPTGGEFYNMMTNGKTLYDRASSKEASLELYRRGIKGIQYLDGDSRSGGKGTYNYVVFNGQDVRVMSKTASRKFVSKMLTSKPIDVLLSGGQPEEPFRDARDTPGERFYISPGF